MDNLYMFAIMPPPELATQINKERQVFAENYNCVKALKPPVHITLYDPFKNSDAFEEEIIGMQQWAGNQAPFNVGLKNYNFFKNPVSPVVYIEVVKNDNLTLLHKRFVIELRKYLDIESNSNNKYTPHITIGYRDVPPALFPDIVKNYSKRPFNAVFEVNSIYLWKHDGKNWQIQNEFKLGKAEHVQTALF